MSSPPHSQISILEERTQLDNTLWVFQLLVCTHQLYLSICKRVLKPSFENSNCIILALLPSVFQWCPSRTPLTRTTGRHGPTSRPPPASRWWVTTSRSPTPSAFPRAWPRRPATACCSRSTRSAPSPSPWRRECPAQSNFITVNKKTGFVHL